MPYLVDSVTMELNRHGADILLIVHPVLTVHRDVAGAAHGTSYADNGATETDADAVRESWIHVELGHVDDTERLAADLRRVLDDVRVAMEDQRRMRSAARDLVELLADGGPEEAEASELLAWLSAGHFTFLGYRAYDLVGEDEPELKPVPGTGLGILRHDGAASFAVTPPGGKHGRARARLLVLAKSSTLSTVYRPSYLDYVAVRRLARRRARSSGSTASSGCTAAAYTESVTRIPVLRAQGRPGARDRRGPADGHDGKALHRDPRGLSRARSSSRSARERACPDRDGRARPRRAQAGAPVRASRRLRALRLLPGLPPERPVHHAGQAACTGDTAQRVRRRLRRLQRDGGQLRPGPAARRGARHARLPLAKVDQAALQTRIAAAVRSWDDDLAAEAQRQLGPERATVVLRGCANSIPQTYKADIMPADALTDLAVVQRTPRGVRAVRAPPFDCPQDEAGGCGSSGFPRSRSRTCCRSCSTWGWRCSTSARTSCPGDPARSGSTISAFAVATTPGQPPKPRRCAPGSRPR